MRKACKLRNYVQLRTDRLGTSGGGTLTSHITKVVKKCSRKVPVNSDHPKLPASVRLMRAKNAALRRARFPLPLIGPTREPPTAYWQVAKTLKSDGYEPVPALKNPDNTLAFEDREKLSVSPTALKDNAHTPPPHDPLHISD
ncbi:hypothetical protein EVAR_53073_1 [Eumeta japonica]|uniref:Uncharacterized protein n=1 Tax=Eumeta variegata TaxID=151549 RepID=A0A4C1YXS0_EUMVA|nr:hypothetical protein EVAR_53073_1 [Eumeta japonica]